MTVTTNALEYGYANDIPGAAKDNAGDPREVTGTVPDNIVVALGPQELSPAPFQDMVTSPTETTYQEQNPWPAASPQSPTWTAAQEAGAPPGDTDNPGVNEDQGDDEGEPMTDHSQQVPGVPTNVGAVATLAAGIVDVTWDAPVDADGYAIDYYLVHAVSSDGGVAVNTSCAGDSMLSGMHGMEVSGLTTGKHYTFTVTAGSDAVGVGAASAPSGAVVAP